MASKNIREATLYCRYCRHFSPASSTVCSNCGASDGLEPFRFGGEHPMDQSPKLPVKSLSKQAALLPFQHFPLFARLALVPVVLTILSQIMGGYLANRTGHWYFYLLWFLAFWFFSIPFYVGWTKLAVEGTASIASRSSVQYGRVEARYFIASVLVTTVLFGPGLISLGWAYSSGWAAIPIIVTAIIFVALIVFGWRFMFVLTTIALDRFTALGNLCTSVSVVI